MKKTGLPMNHISLLMISVICFFALSSVQSQTYSFSTSNEPYQFITNGTSAVKDSWDDPGLAISTGFNFEYFGANTNVLYSLDDFVGGYFAANLNLEALNLLIAFGVDLIDRGFEIDSAMSPIYYKTEGPVGNRVFTLEYNNAGFYSGVTDSLNIYIDFVNFQVRLFEESGDIEMHIGPYSVSDPELVFDAPGPVIGLVEGYHYFDGTVTGEVLLLSGNALTPDLITTFEESYVTWPIPENTVYRFTNTTTAIRDIWNTSDADYYFPNPSHQNISLRAELIDQIISPVYVINALGQLMIVDEAPSVIELNHLPAGIYGINFRTAEGWRSQRISLIK